MTIYFYGSKGQPYGCFSNFSPHGFELDGTWWPTSEHYFQAQKLMPYRILCNGVQQEGAKLSPALASELFCYVPLHKIRYGVINSGNCTILSDTPNAAMT